MSSSQRRLRRPSLSSVPPSERVYVIPTVHDVLRGRGGRTNTHPGNQRLLELVRPLEAAYAVLKRGQKARMSLGMVDKVHAWGGRFLEKEVDSHGKELFFVMDQEGAVKLVEQKFRDEPNKRKSSRHKQFSKAKSKTKKSKDCKSAKDEHERLDFDEYKSWDLPVPVPVTNSTSPDLSAEPEKLEESLIHFVSPAHTLEDPEWELASDEDVDRDDVSLTEEELSDLTADPYAWGKVPAGVVDDPSLYLSDDVLVEMWLEGSKLFEDTS